MTSKITYSSFVKWLFHRAEHRISTLVDSRLERCLRQIFVILSTAKDHWGPYCMTHGVRRDAK